jgi:hypothetical protein
MSAREHVAAAAGEIDKGLTGRLLTIWISRATDVHEGKIVMRCGRV